ncbi:unnamed protein product, partial [Mesorhabditis belari]|uniref:Uncharacterized protein n=1 Tax=Mesorhabditis belari TaxID=2138241 RepID=A0AAF3ELE1_9BILA
MGVLPQEIIKTDVINDEIFINSTYSFSAKQWTREQIVTAVSFAYVVISILMVLLWSAYLCFDGRKAPRRDTRVIHMLAQRTVFRL